MAVRANLAFQPEGLQLLAVCSKGVCFQAARPGGEVGEVNFLNEFRLFDVERLINVVGLRKPSGQFEQIRTHRPVREERLRL